MPVPPNRDIDLRLSELAEKRSGETLTAREIAEYAGCSKRLIEMVEKRGLQKLRTALLERGIFTSEQFQI